MYILLKPKYYFKVQLTKFNVILKNQGKKNLKMGQLNKKLKICVYYQVSEQNLSSLNFQFL